MVEVGSAPSPPPSRASRGPVLAAAVIGVAIGVAGTLAVTAITDDDGSGTTVAVAPSAAADDSAGDATPSGDDDDTAVAPTTAPLPEPTFTSLEAVLYPADVGTLGATLDRLGFPPWWWLPESVAPSGDPQPTVRRVEVEDYIVSGGVSRTGGYERSTTWYLTTTDTAAVEEAVVAALPAAEFDIDSGRAAREVAEQNGRTEIDYYFPSARGRLTDSLQLNVREVSAAGAPQPEGVEVSLTLTVQVDDPPAAVPTGPGDERAFLAAAPVSGIMRWNRTRFLAAADPDVGASGSYAATFTAPPDGLDRVVAFLSDPENFPGPLELVQPGRFTTDDRWEQPMAFGDLLGRYEVLKPSVGAANDLFITLSFPLA